MKQYLITKLIAILISLLTPELLRNFADTVLTWVEEKVKGSASTVDDAAILPLCEVIRVVFGLKDQD